MVCDVNVSVAFSSTSLVISFLKDQERKRSFDEGRQSQNVGRARDHVERRRSVRLCCACYPRGWSNSSVDLRVNGIGLDVAFVKGACPKLLDAMDKVLTEHGLESRQVQRVAVFILEGAVEVTVNVF